MVGTWYRFFWFLNLSGRKAVYKCVTSTISGTSIQSIPGVVE